MPVSRPGDRWEREADRIADRVMRLPEGTGPVARTSTRPWSGAQRCPGGCPGEDDETLLRWAEPPATRPAATTAADGVAGSAVARQAVTVTGGGRPLPAGQRGWFEQRFGHDFSRVRVHDTPSDAAAAAGIHARAFTLGRDVVFARGAYAPGSRRGRRLLAHELAHVVQQGAAHRLGDHRTGDAP